MCRCLERRQIISDAVKRKTSPRVMVKRLGKTVWQDAQSFVRSRREPYWPPRKTRASL
jgi:hypothetical protein